MNVIDSFDGDYRWLSNFYFSPVQHEGILYPTSEHAFQAAKTTNTNLRRKIAKLTSAAAAKSEGRALILRPGWENMKLQVMSEILESKFDLSPQLREKLLATGNAQLVEGNYWHDTYWGVCGGRGENHLGKLLMQLREKLRGI